MPIARETVARRVKPHSNAVVIPVTLGATTVAGELVALQSDGFWDPAIATGVVKSCGVAVKGGSAGDPDDVVMLGGVTCLTGATPGAIVYVSDTAGEPSETAGTKTTIVGIALSATDLFVNPSTVSLV